MEHDSINRHAIEPALNVRGIPLGLREQFKARCALKGVTMSEAIIMFMKEVVKEVPLGNSGNIGSA